MLYLNVYALRVTLLYDTSQEELLEIFGPAEKTLTLILTEEKKLARAEATLRLRPVVPPPLVCTRQSCLPHNLPCVLCG